MPTTTTSILANPLDRRHNYHLRVRIVNATAFDDDRSEVTIATEKVLCVFEWDDRLPFL